MVLGAGKDKYPQPCFRDLGGPSCKFRLKFRAGMSTKVKNIKPKRVSICHTYSTNPEGSVWAFIVQCLGIDGSYVQMKPLKKRPSNWKLVHVNTLDAQTTYERLKPEEEEDDDDDEDEGDDGDDGDYDADTAAPTFDVSGGGSGGGGGGGGGGSDNGCCSCCDCGGGDSSCCDCGSCCCDCDCTIL
ncbi:hypothetical protein Pelo_7307 [Pelomyxa schiedti]|nr:hypothetical protein Pelo_7307 [Pelomyxa schiedti]